MTTSAKEPVFLTLLIETAKYRWFVGGIEPNGVAMPLLCSEEGNLARYVDLPFDEQASFLRHRLSGVLQAGFNRLWERGKKPLRIVFVADAEFAAAGMELTVRVAEHFVEWMTRPPVSFFLGNAKDEAQPLRLIAGESESSQQAAILQGWLALQTASENSSAWELTARKA